MLSSFLVAYITGCELSQHIRTTRSSAGVHHLTCMASASSSFRTIGATCSFNPSPSSLSRSSSLTISSRLTEISGTTFSTNGPKVSTSKRNLRARCNLLRKAKRAGPGIAEATKAGLSHRSVNSRCCWTRLCQSTSCSTRCAYMSRNSMYPKGCGDPVTSLNRRSCQLVDARPDPYLSTSPVAAAADPPCTYRKLCQEASGTGTYLPRVPVMAWEGVFLNPSG
jgi:hypothetical protein